jgi:hypothetical protein
MESTGEPKKLFKYYLDQTIKQRDNRPLFFRRNMRWRVNSKEYGYPLSKKGLLRGYIKYGIFAYLTWHYFKVAITPSHSHHAHEGHGAHGHGVEQHGHYTSHADESHHHDKQEVHKGDSPAKLH